MGARVRAPCAACVRGLRVRGVRRRRGCQGGARPVTAGRGHRAAGTCRLRRGRRRRSSAPGGRGGGRGWRARGAHRTRLRCP
eukprot:4270376-Prymnesium_polylepis.1